MWRWLLLESVLLGALGGGLYIYAERACPPPSWASWRYTDGPNGAQNFACVAGRG